MAEVTVSEGRATGQALSPPLPLYPTSLLLPLLPTSLLLLPPHLSIR